MNKIKRVAKRFIAGILSIVTCISVFIISPGISLVAYAEPTSATHDASEAKATAGKMMQNFANGGMTSLSIGDITENEFRAWGILLSNYYIPFLTKITEVGPDENPHGGLYLVKDGSEVDYTAWGAFKNVWVKEAKSNSADSSTLEILPDLIEKYNRVVCGGCKALYFGGGIFTKDGKESCPAQLYMVLDSLALNYGGWYLYWTDDNEDTDDISKRHVVFEKPMNSDAGEAITALLSCIKMMDTLHISSSSADLNSRLCVTPFGDICYSPQSAENIMDLTVLIPACMNPFAFNHICDTEKLKSEEEKEKFKDELVEGDHFENLKFYLNNIFGLSNFLQVSDITNRSVNGNSGFDKYVDITGIKKNELKRNFFNTEISSDKVVRNLSDVLHFGKMITFNGSGKIKNETELYAITDDKAKKISEQGQALFKEYEDLCVTGIDKSKVDANSGLSGLMIKGNDDKYRFMHMYKYFDFYAKDNSTISESINNVEYNTRNGFLNHYSKDGILDNNMYSEWSKYCKVTKNIGDLLSIQGTNKSVFQPLWSIYLQQNLSNNLTDSRSLGMNSIAVVGRSSDLDFKKNNEGKYVNNFMKNFNNTYFNFKKLLPLHEDDINKKVNAFGYSTDKKSTYQKMKISGDLFKNYSITDMDFRNEAIFKTYTTLGNYENTHNTNVASGVFHANIDTLNKDTVNKVVSSDKMTRFVSFYLGSLVNDADFVNSVATVIKHEAVTAPITLAGLVNFGDITVQDAYNSLNVSDISNVGKLVHFEIPADKVVMKLGIFSNGIATTQASSSMKLNGNLGIYTIDLINDTSDRNTAFKEYKTETSLVNNSVVLPECLDLLGISNSKGIRSDNSYVLKCKGTKYTLDNDKKYTTGDTFEYNAWYFSVNRNLLANIWWAYIEDIVGITADNLSASLTNGTEVTRIAKDFSHLPSMTDSNEFLDENLLGFLSESDGSLTEEIQNRELEEKQASIIDWVYKILSVGDTINNIGDIVAEKATAAGQYVIGWLKGMIDSLFIGWNNYMLGVDVSAGVTGSVSNVGNSTKSKTYSTAMGYMTTPSFSNLPITSWIMSNFQLIYVIIMIVVVVILIMMVLTRARRLPQAILIFVCMAFIIVLPANMLNGAIGISNNFTESVYADKFQYWAISQHAEYLSGVSYTDSQMTLDLYHNLMSQDESGGAGITLKWMAPKKWGISERIKAAAKNTDGLKLFLAFAGDRVDNEDYSNYTPGSTYLYRPYYGIYVEAHNLKFELDEKNSANISLTELGKKINNLWFGGSSAKEYKVNADMKTGNSIADAQNIKNGVVRNSNFFRYVSTRGDSIMRSAIGGTGFGNSKNGIMTYQTPYFDSYYKDSQVIKDIQPQFKNQSRIYEMYSDINLISALFNFNINNTLFNDSNNPCGLWLYKAGKDSSNTVNSDGSSSNTYTTGIKAYFDYSESPYYYFYNVLSDLKVANDSGDYVYGSTDFVDLILKNETFKVTNQQSKAYGELKDYLDLEGLFSYVIPLLNQGNQNAQQYFDKYGNEVDRSDSIFSDNTITERYDIDVSSKAEESSTTSENSKAEESSNSNDNTSVSSTGFKTFRTAGEDLYDKYEQQLQAVWNMYSPWVAQMIAANNKSEKVRSGFGYVELLEPWNPADYRYFGRDMAFSPADARVHGYQSYDLSNVETKMHKVLEDTYYDILDLVNYKDYTKVNEMWGNDVLISAAAMCATFNFNREFSDNGFMSTDITLYPQSYELKNMNFDAYLRIILGNSMGMNPVTMKNSDYSGSLTIYEEFIHNTSVWSGLVLVAEDFLAVFVVPLLKIMLIVVIFVLALALAVSCIINKPDKMIKVFLSTFIAPLFGMTAIFMAHSLVISWFIGDGVGANVIDTHSISVTTGDPTLTLLLMIVVDLVTSILMWKLLKFAAKSTAKYIQDIGSGIAALGKGTFSGLAKVITAAAGVGTLALGAASAVGGAAKATVGGAVGAGKAISHKKEVHQERKLDKERNKLLKEGSKSGTGTGKSKTGTGGSGTGIGTSKPTGATGVGNKHTESMASDIKAIRQKLEKGFNPAGMTPTGSTSTGTGTADRKKISSKGNNVTPGSTAMKQQDEFNKRRAGVAAEKLRGGSAEDRTKYALQTKAMTDRFEKLKKDNNAVFDKKSGKWTSDGSATTTTKINRLYTDINKRKSAMYQATSSVEPVRSSSVNVGTHGVRTGKHSGGSKRKKSKKNRKAKR